MTPSGRPGIIFSEILFFQIFIVPGCVIADVFIVTFCFCVNVIIAEKPVSFESVVEKPAIPAPTEIPIPFR